MANEKITDWNITLDQLTGRSQRRFAARSINTSIFFSRIFTRRLRLTHWLGLIWVKS